MHIKPGVRLRGLKPEIALALQVAKSCFQEVGKRCTVTSITDGVHQRGSLHHTGEAADLRDRHLDKREAEIVLNLLRKRLGPSFDVVQETTHIHLEYDPE